MLTTGRIFSLIVLIIIIMLVAACTNDPEVLTNKARDLSKEGELEKAMEIFDRVLNRDPSYVDAYYTRAVVCLDAGDHAQAAADLDSVVDLAPDFEIDPSMAAAYFQRGLSHKSAGDIKSATNDFSRALTIDIAHVAALSERSQILQEMGEYNSAADDLDALQELDPDYPLTSNEAEVYFRRALNRLDAGELDQSVADFEKVIGLNPSHKQALYNCGLAHLRAGDSTAALDELDRVLELDPDIALDQEVAELFFDRGMASLNQEQLDNAVEDLSIALRADPRYLEAAIGSGMALLSQGKLDQAIADFTLAIDLDPENAEAYAERAAAHTAQENSESALADYDQSISLDPTRVDTRLNRAAIHVDAGDIILAIEDFTAVIDLKPDHIQAIFSRGLAHEQLGNMDPQIADLEAVIDIEPDHFQANQKLASIYVEIGRYDEAIDRIDQVILLDPEYTDVYDQRSTANEALGHIDVALADLTIYIENSAEDDGLYARRGDLYVAIESYKEAADDYERASEMNPSQSEHWFKLGLARIEADELEESLNALNQATALEPEWIDPYLHRAEIFEQMAIEYDEAQVEEKARISIESAVEQYNAGLELDSKNSVAYQNRGKAHFLLGNYEAAIEDMTSVTVSDPIAAEPYYFIARAHYELGQFREAKDALEVMLTLEAEPETKEDAERLLEEIEEALQRTAKPAGIKGLPVMPGAAEISYTENGGGYKISASLSEINGWYIQQLPAYGWQSNQGDIWCPDGGAFLMMYDQGDQGGSVVAWQIGDRVQVVLIAGALDEMLPEITKVLNLLCISRVIG